MEQICYKKNFLTSVIVRMDFPVAVEEIGHKFPYDLKMEVIKGFPISEPRPGFEQEMQLSPVNISHKKTEFTEWRFHDKKRTKTITFVPKATFIEYHKYSNFEDLKKDFLPISKKFLSIYKDLSIVRMGLRYINEIELNDTDDPLKWDGYINKKMLGMHNFLKEEEDILRIFNNFEIGYANFNIRFQYGLFNPDYPAPIKKKSFILDYDAYFSGPLSFDDTENGLNEYHEKIQSLFEASITDKLRQVLNE
jgi:uncharacterized protein (TIGR04255 family)